jgi:hypothetical protein
VKQQTLDFGGDSDQEDRPVEAPGSHGETQNTVEPRPTSPLPAAAQREADRQSYAMLTDYIGGIR